MTTLTSSQLQDLPIMTYIRAVDVWIFSCLVFVICAFLETVLILVLLGKDQMDIPAEQASKERHAIATLGISLHDLMDPTGKVCFFVCVPLFICLQVSVFLSIEVGLCNWV